MYICQYPNWSGTCFWTEIYPSMYNHCMVIIAAGGWASLGPDADIAVDLYRYVVSPFLIFCCVVLCCVVSRFSILCSLSCRVVL
jgi:hypothetical protein